MKYRICVIGDIHWGAFDANRALQNLSLFKEFIIQIDHLDLIVIAGDYFDTKLSMSSKSALHSIQFMNDVYEICRDRGIKLRIVSGTESHDNKQLQAFNYLSQDNQIFKLCERCTLEETLPGLMCIYCPDETVNTESYMDEYFDILMRHGETDIMFFHGNFDVVLPDVVLQQSELSEIENIVYQYDFYKARVRLMVGGHWHNGDNHQHLYYTRSYDRWEFNEELPKGFIFITYDTDNKSYYLKRINNILSPEYRTYEVYTNLYKTIDDYSALIDDVSTAIGENEELRVRIHIINTENTPDNEAYINLIRQKFINSRRVKVAVKNAIKGEIEKKKKEKERHEIIRNRYSFVKDKNLSISEIIQRFILETKQKDVPIDIIDKFIKKYIKDE